MRENTGRRYSEMTHGRVNMQKKYNLPCNIARTLDIVGDRWTLLIIRDLLLGLNKFNELKASLTGIAPNILSERLQHLESNGIVRSVLYSQHPPRFEYHLTDAGKALKDVIFALAIWGNRFFTEKYASVVHSSCGHEVDMAYYCPHCNETVSDVGFQKL